MRSAIYGSREGVEQGLTILTERPLPRELREEVIEDTLNGSSEAVRAWLDHGMQMDISNRMKSVQVPAIVIVGDADKVENETTLRRELGKCIPEARFEVPGVLRRSHPGSTDGTRVASHDRRGFCRNSSDQRYAFILVAAGWTAYLLKRQSRFSGITCIPKCRCSYGLRG